MDPAIGRRWITAGQLLRDVYHHQMQVPADAWTEWARSGEFTSPLSRRLRSLGVAPKPLLKGIATKTSEGSRAGLPVGLASWASLARALAAYATALDRPASTAGSSPAA